MSLAQRKGYYLAIITGGRGNCLKVRFDAIGIQHVYMDCHEKLKTLKQLCEKLDFAAG